MSTELDVVALREQLKIDEGVEYEIYNDSLGYPTFGIGHLIIESDPEFGKPIGTPVSEERVAAAFEADMKWVLNDCRQLYSDWDDLPGECKSIIANMMFNMGLTRLRKFKGMKRAVDARDWNKAADEMVDSIWYRQVGNRSIRLVARMRVLA